MGAAVARNCAGVSPRLLPAPEALRYVTTPLRHNSTVPHTIMKEDNDLTIVAPVPEDRYAEVLDHVTPIFLRDEPLSRCFAPCASGARAEDFRAYAAQQLRSGLCVVALSGARRDGAGGGASGGAVVGACLNRALPRGKVIGVDVETLGEEDDDPLNKNILRLLTTVHQRLDLFSSMRVQEVLEIGLVSVAPSHTGRGLGTRLVRTSLELGALRGFKAAKADATGMASAKACQRAGLVQVLALPYEDYRPHGEVIFKSTKAPDDVLRVLAGRLQSTEPYVLPPEPLHGKM